jgi:hypothetical protein
VTIDHGDAAESPERIRDAGQDFINRNNEKRG